jgi:hypothetical protein
MRMRFVLGAALLALALWTPAARPEEKTTPPTLIVRVSSLDNLIADARYLVELAGKEEEAKQAEEFLKSLRSEKGLEGVDTTRPLGLYGTLNPSVIDSEVVLLVPIADQKVFLDMLERINLKVENKDGVYQLEIEKVPFPVFFRFSNKYLYVTLRDKATIATEKLLDPSTILGGTAGALSITVNLDRVPDELKRMVIGQSALQIANLKEKDEPGETGTQKAFRVALLDELMARFKSLVNDGRQVRLGLNIDRKGADISLSASFRAKPGSNLATAIAELGQGPSVGAGLISSDSAMSVALNVALPENLRTALAPVIDEGVKKAVNKEENQVKRDLLDGLLKAVTPTLKMAELDGAIDFRGPGAGELYTAVAALKVKDGPAIEEAIKKVIKSLPEDQKAAIKIDFDKVGSINIHRMTPDKVDTRTRERFGDNPIYIAVREDAVLIAGGEKGLDALKEGLASSPKAGKVGQVEIAIARIAKLAEEDSLVRKAMPEAAKKAFKEKDSDKVYLTLTGGKALELRMSMKAQIVTFASLLDQVRKGR